MSLPPEAIDEILEMASQRHEVPSPRGVADPSVFAASPPGNEGKRKGAGSAVECLEYAAPSTPYSAMDHFRDKAHAQRGISMCAERFLTHVAKKAFTMTGYCHRMRVQPRDVAEALEVFVRVDANDAWYRSFPTGSLDEDEDDGAVGKGKGNDEEMDDEIDQDWQEVVANEESKEKVAEDDTLVYDSDSENEDEEAPPSIEDAVYTLSDAEAPEFDAAFPPVDERKQMTDEQFREQVLVPVLREHSLSGGPRGFGVDILLKRAMYAFLVAKLS